MPTSPTLKSALSLPLITFYGLGSIIGAGIYVLIGEVAGKAGMYAPIAFTFAAIIAGFTAFSYAELSSRLPRSAGEAVYIQQAFGIKWLSTAVGYSVVSIGVVSCATMVNGFVGYLNVFVDLPGWLAITLLVLGMGLIASWGISESVMVAAFITLLEIAGLIFVLFMAGDSLITLPARWHELTPTMDKAVWTSILAGAFLAFYAYIGFEDMVNVAEEVKDASRLMPKAIILALVISSILYLSVALVAVLALPVEELAASDAPLATVLAAQGDKHTLFISAISLIAVVNGAMIQIIMASRVLYGMASTGLAPQRLGAIHPRTRTPLFATLLTTFTILAFALWLPLVTLAQMTSFITLMIFATVNLALIRLKLRTPHVPGVTHYPLWIPMAGSLLSLLFLGIHIGSVVH
jgi:amino acid transporter